MISLKCWWHGHKFIRLGRARRGLTVEKYVQCDSCAKVIIIITLPRSLTNILEKIEDYSPIKLYFERKIINRHKRSLFKMKKNSNGEQQ